MKIDPNHDVASKYVILCLTETVWHVYIIGMKLRVTYAKSRYKDKTYITPLVVTSYRDKNGTARNKTLANLSKLPSFVVKIIEESLKRGDSSVLDEYVLINELQHIDSVSIGPVFVALSLCKQLGIYELVSKHLPKKQVPAVLSIIIERIISQKPLSVSALQRCFEDESLSILLDIDKVPVLKYWYQALAQFEESRESILCDLFKRNRSSADLFLYDITSSYFEGDTCELAEFGYNRDGKKGKKQVVIGIVCNDEGCPIWVEVFKGNTSDQTTVKKQLTNLKEKLGVTHFTFVGDRGMVTHARIEELEKDGWWESFSYITALTRKEMMSLVEDEDHPIQIELFDHMNLSEVEVNQVRYVLCHNPYRQENDRQTRLRLLKLTENKLDNIRQNVEAGRLKKRDIIAKRVYRWLNHWNMGRFFSVHFEEGLFSFDRTEAEIERYSRLDGCYVIRSNSPNQNISAAELQQRYKDLKVVEQAFRTMKTTDIQTRPIRHFGVPQVKGHIFACFLAYRVIWEMRQRLSPMFERDEKKNQCEAGSMAEIWRTLSRISLAKVEARGKVHFKPSKIKDPARKILNLCKISGLETFCASKKT